jgi:hypothetical protein
MLRESRLDLLWTGAGIEQLDLQPKGATSSCHLSQGALAVGGICRVDEHGHATGGGHQFA